MDEFVLQLSDLARAGWSLQIIPEQDARTLPATRAIVLWSFEWGKAETPSEPPEVYPLIN